MIANLRAIDSGTVGKLTAAVLALTTAPLVLAGITLPGLFWDYFNILSMYAGVEAPVPLFQALSNVLMWAVEGRDYVYRPAYSLYQVLAFGAFGGEFWLHYLAKAAIWGAGVWLAFRIVGKESDLFVASAAAVAVWASLGLSYGMLFSADMYVGVAALYVIRSVQVRWHKFVASPLQVLWLLAPLVVLAGMKESGAGIAVAFAALMSAAIWLGRAPIRDKLVASLGLCLPVLFLFAQAIRSILGRVADPAGDLASNSMASVVWPSLLNLAPPSPFHAMTVMVAALTILAVTLHLLRFFRRGSRDEIETSGTPVLVVVMSATGFVVAFAFATLGQIQVGLRYIAPAAALLFVFLATAFRSGRNAGIQVAVLALASIFLWFGARDLYRQMYAYTVHGNYVRMAISDAAEQAYNGRDVVVAVTFPEWQGGARRLLLFTLPQEVASHIRFDDTAFPADVGSFVISNGDPETDCAACVVQMRRFDARAIRESGVSSILKWAMPLPADASAAAMLRWDIGAPLMSADRELSTLFQFRVGEVIDQADAMTGLAYAPLISLREMIPAGGSEAVPLSTLTAAPGQALTLSTPYFRQADQTAARFVLNSGAGRLSGVTAELVDQGGAIVRSSEPCSDGIGVCLYLADLPMAMYTVRVTMRSDRAWSPLGSFDVEVASSRSALPELSLGGLQ